MIGRCEADPETSVIRTISFEVDFDDFTVRSCEGCPPQFLDLAKACCQVRKVAPSLRVDVKSGLVQACQGGLPPVGVSTHCHVLYSCRDAAKYAIMCVTDI